MALERKGLSLEGRDRISNLPDDILVKILGLLETNNAVATSILSKRWRKLYQFLSHFRCTMGFNVLPRDSEEAHDKVANFLESLYKIVCTVPKLKSLVTEFDLFNSNFDDSLNTRVLSALWRRIEHLELLNRGRQYFEVPFSSIYRGDVSLRSLALAKCLLMPSPLAGTFRTFQSLKKLALHKCLFYEWIVIGEESKEEAEAFDEVVGYAEERLDALLKSCPVLEKLTIEHCQVYPKLGVNQSCSQLKQLIISHCAADLVEIANAPKLERVECTMQHPVSIVSLPCLKHFKLEYLEEMNLYFEFDKISTNAPNLETLILCFADGKVHFLPEDCSFPFQKLKSLVLDAKRPEMCNLFWIGRILELAPFLETFELRIDRTYFSEDFVEMLEQPSNFHHSHLKELKVTGFEGKVMDMNLVSFVMERADALGSVTLSREGTLIAESETRKQIENLERLKERINSNAQITVR